MGTDQPLWPKIAQEPFHFRCHPGVSCFLACCRKVELRLFPYDVLRLKNKLSLHSAEFLERYTRLGAGSHPYFPAVFLNMQDQEEGLCPFLSPEGCSVYADRPSACRTYPLERAVEYSANRELTSHYYLTQHSTCLGHREAYPYTIKQWEREQQLASFNLFNDLWAELDVFFATDPWQGEGYAGPRQQLAFMVCYTVDTFRTYAQEHRLLHSSRLDRDRRRRIEQEDSELLKFGFDWLRHILARQG
jgi:Fe-S-cluster containining protein